MSDFHNSEIESILAEAIERVESGAMVDAVIASYPAAYRDELEEILFVVDAVQQVGAEPVPMPSAERRASAKQDFLAFAREIAAEDEAAAPVANDAMDRLDAAGTGGSYTRPTNGRARPASLGDAPRRDERGWFDRLADRIGDAFAIPTARLAPIAATLLLAILSIGSFYTVAWSVPGDIAYPFKEWTRKVQLDVASPDERDELARTLDEARAEELAAAQERVDQTIEGAASGEAVDLNDAVRTAKFTTIYNGRINGDLLDFGAIDVLPRFQPDANDPATFVDIEIADGKTLDDLVEGVEVEVSVQIVPDADEFVQGLQLTILTPAEPSGQIAVATTESEEPAAEAPVADGAATPEANTPAQSVTANCTPSSPAGWSSYVVEKGETLSSIAARYGLNMDNLARQNCISDFNRLVWGSVVRVPGQVVEQNAGGGQQTNSNTSSTQQPSAPTVESSVLQEQDGTAVPELIVPTVDPEPTADQGENAVEPTPEQPTEAESDDQTDGPGEGDAPDSGDPAAEGETNEGEANEGETNEGGEAVVENPDGSEGGYPPPVVPDTTVQITTTVVTTETGGVVDSTVEVTATLEAGVEPTIVPTNTSVAPTVIPTIVTITTTVPTELPSTSTPSTTTGDSEETSAGEVITATVFPAVVTPIQPETGTGEAESGEATEPTEAESDPGNATSEPEPTETTSAESDGSPDSGNGEVAEPESSPDADGTDEGGSAEDEEGNENSGANAEEAGSDEAVSEEAAPGDGTSGPSPELAVEEAPDSAEAAPETATEADSQGATQDEAASENSTSADGSNNSAIEVEPTLPPTIESAPTAVPPTAIPPTAVPPTAVPPTAAPPTAVPPTAVPPTAVPPTAVPTTAPPTAVPPTVVPPTAVPPTAVPPTAVPTTAPPTAVPPTAAPTATPAP